MKRYVPRRTRRRRRILAAVLTWLLAVGAVAGFIVVRKPSLFPGAPGLLEEAEVVRDLLRLSRTLKTTVRSAEFWGHDLLVLGVEIQNGSRFVILCQDLRLVDRSGKVYAPSSASMYYVNRDESLWMRQANPGRSIAGKFAFAVPDGTFGLSVAIETQVGVIRLAPIKEISRRKK
ncbi:MAG: hypothetical protein AB1700_04300 [Bacillota bacterium]